MFYAQFVLSKKGPLAKIWLAAHWEKKLSKAQIFETDVQDAVDEILKPRVKMALRTTGHLLLGIVRIYSRKAKYLLADCNEAFLKIKMAFRPGQIDLPEGGQEAQFNAITLALPEVYNDIDSVLPEISDVDLIPTNQSRVDDITMKEDLPGQKDPFAHSYSGDDFGENVTIPNDFGHASAIEEVGRDGSMLDNIDAPFGDDLNFGAGLDNMFKDEDIADTANSIDDDMDLEMGEKSLDTTANNDESFALEPLDQAVMQGLEKVARPKRKRRLIVDEQKNIGGDEMKQNMANYSDTINSNLDLAPPTKKLMQLKETGSVDRLYQNPGSANVARSKTLVRLYQSHLVLRCRVDEPTSTVYDELQLIREDELESFDANHEQQMQSSVVRAEEPYEDDDAVGLVPIDELSPENGIMSPKERNSSPDKKKERKSRQSAVERDEEEDGEEEHRWTKRTQNVLKSIAVKLKSAGDNFISFTDLTKNATRKSAAQKFYTLLVLKKSQAIDVKQRGPFEEIQVAAGPQMDSSISL